MMWRNKGHWPNGLISISAFTSVYPDAPAALFEAVKADFNRIGFPHVLMVPRDVNLGTILTERKMSLGDWSNLRVRGNTFLAFVNENDCVMARLLT